MVDLCVNVDHVATLRQARRGVEPDPIAVALQAEMAGAVGITVHLREDRRHIQERDLRLLREVVRGKLNLEMAPVEEMKVIAIEVRPDQVTLVPERRQELTTEGGVDAHRLKGSLEGFVPALRDAGLLVSLFIDPAEPQIKAAKELGVDSVEINTARYSEARKPADIDREFAQLQKAVEEGRAAGLGVHAGHGLDYFNTGRVAALSRISELNIGYSIVSRSLFVGVERAVREMVGILRQTAADGG